ncbi:putative N(5)-glutamine methyltransferase PrmC [Sandaracinus amylolyticus]|uniref:Release factor glutamine methyltransferase n=1 Tax=Sandaracinus amylolyticus TaxID=927083 RepID=A0A0F6YHU8_9BACT|nr:putative N(5)-glutamine methyltransferase PrmC [Sandaracinus amylolyticus]
MKWSADDFASRGIESARLDAELLVAHALGLDRVKLYMDLDRPLAPDELTKIRELVLRRRKREPVAYILGRREFFGRGFEVSPAVLIPRPDTETLIEAALERLPEDASGAVLDLCTGSGAIAVTLAAERTGIEVDATDLSEAALEVAKKNASKLGVAERVRFHHGDLFAALPSPREYALIACNPPYIAEHERATLAPDVAQHEPGMALFSGPEGLDVLHRLCAEAPKWLAPGASILIEVGAGQAPAVIALLERAGLVEGRAHQDLGGHERVVEARRARSGSRAAT